LVLGEVILIRQLPLFFQDCREESLLGVHGSLSLFLMQRERRRIGFYGGSFDPVHEGHLSMARAALNHLRLDRVCLVPARQNPLKPTGPEASDAARLEMLYRAIGDEPRLGTWEGELERDGPSYTYETIRHVGQVYPNSHLFWIIGADQLPYLDRWYRIEDLVHLVGFILLQRPGYDFPWPGIPGLRIYPVNNEEVPISSTEIRKRSRSGDSLDGWVPAAVSQYIRTEGLYTS
jgi:nicotinate-nucleotide adenylyltransferase